MSSTKKILIAVSTLLVVMLLLPVLAVNFAPADAGLAVAFLLFFVIDPLTVLALGVMAGTELRKLWWIPVVSVAVFPFFFSVAVWEPVMELFIYSAMYLPVGVLAMLGTHYGIKYLKKKKQ